MSLEDFSKWGFFFSRGCEELDLSLPSRFGAYISSCQSVVSRVHILKLGCPPVYLLETATAAQRRRESAAGG